MSSYVNNVVNTSIVEGKTMCHVPVLTYDNLLKKKNWIRLSELWPEAIDGVCVGLEHHAGFQDGVHLHPRGHRGSAGVPHDHIPVMAARHKVLAVTVTWPGKHTQGKSTSHSQNMCHAKTWTYYAKICRPTSVSTASDQDLHFLTIFRSTEYCIHVSFSINSAYFL